MRVHVRWGGSVRPHRPECPWGQGPASGQRFGARPEPSFQARAFAANGRNHYAGRARAGGSPLPVLSLRARARGLRRGGRAGATLGDYCARRHNGPTGPVAPPGALLAPESAGSESVRGPLSHGVQLKLLSVRCPACPARREEGSSGSTINSPLRSRLFGLGNGLDLPERLWRLLDVRARPEPPRFRLRRILAHLVLRDVQRVHKRLCKCQRPFPFVVTYTRPPSPHGAESQHRQRGMDWSGVVPARNRLSGAFLSALYLSAFLFAGPCSRVSARSSWPGRLRPTLFEKKFMFGSATSLLLHSSYLPRVPVSTFEYPTELAAQRL